MHRRRRQEVLGRPLWGNARNRVCILTTGMRTTQGQAAFGYSIQTIVAYSNIVKTCYHKYCWTRLFIARRTHVLQSSCIHKQSLCELLYLRIIPAKLSRSAKQRPSNSSHLMRPFVRDLSIIYVYQFFIPTDFLA
jgi:hypothetical protein